MKRVKITALLIILLVLLTSCNKTIFDTAALLTAPLMNPADQEMRKAISDAVGGTYELVNPESGNHQTAITPIDILGDEANETFCLYKSGTENYVNFVVLQNQNGKWRSIGLNKSQAMGVDRISFCDLTNDGNKEIIVGWQYQKGEENAIEVFSLTNDGKVKSEYKGMYNDFITFNNSLAVISKNSAAKTASATLISSRENAVTALSTVSLNSSITAFLKIQTSVLNNSSLLIYLDEQLESLAYTTELLVLSTKEDPSISVVNLEGTTMRTKEHTCIDADDDGILDIPIEKRFEAYMRNGAEEYLSYVDWYKITENTPKLIKSTYSSLNEPFYIELKNEWIDRITVEKDETNDRMIHFYTLDGKKPMFSIRVFLRQEYNDSSEKDTWTEIAASGENVYTYKQDGPELDRTFYTDIETIKELFVVLS